MEKSQLLYIYGPASSGKGVLTRLLDGHPALAVHPNHDKIPNGITNIDSWGKINNSKYFKHLRNALGNTNYYQFEDFAHKRDVGIVTNADEHGDANQRMELDFYEAEKEWTNKLISNRPDSCENIILTLFESLFNHWTEYPRPQEKYKYYTGMGAPRPDPMESLVANSDDVKILFIERDPRAVVASHGAKPSNTINNRIKMGITYRARGNIQAARELNSQYPDQVEILSFRKLILDTDNVMSRIAKFLDINDDGILHIPTFCGDELKPRNNFVGEIKDEWKEIVSAPQRCALDLQTRRIPARVNIEGVRMYLLSIFIYGGIKLYKRVGSLGQKELFD